MKLKYILYALIIAIILYYSWGKIFEKKRTLSGTTFYIARDPQWHPLDLLGKELDIQIFCDNLIQQIAQDQGFEVVIESVQNEHLLPGLQKKEYDAIAYPIVEKWENFGLYYFSLPFFSLGPVLVVREEEKNETFADFNGKTIGIVRSSNLMSKVNTVPGIIIAPFDRLFEGLESLINDRIDGFIMDALQAYLFTEGIYKGKLVIKQPALSKAGIKLVTLKTDRSKQFLEAFDQGLLKLISNKSYQTLLEQWHFANYPMPPIDASPLQIESSPL